MEVITTILLCTVGFLVYLVNANNNEVVRLKNILRDTEYLIREKEEENSNLKRQLTSEKNKLLRQPTVNGNEILSLKKQLDKSLGEISDLQKKLREKEKIISELKEKVTDAENMIAFEQYGNEKLEHELRELKSKISSRQIDIENIGISSLKSQLDKRENDVQTLNKVLTRLKNENDELKIKIKKFEHCDNSNFNGISSDKDEILHLNERIKTLNQMCHSLQAENENFRINILKIKNELEEKKSQSGINYSRDEIYTLKNKNYELQNNVQNLNKILSAIKNENDELRIKIRNLENGTLPGIDWQHPKTPRQKKPKRFLRVIFTKGSNRFFDYLLGDNRGIKVGDFVMVSYFDKKKKKSELTAAQVIYISGENEFSENATSKIIGKADYPKW